MLGHICFILYVFLFFCFVPLEKKKGVVEWIVPFFQCYASAHPATSSDYFPDHTDNSIITYFQPLPVHLLPMNTGSPVIALLTTEQPLDAVEKCLYTVVAYNETWFHYVKHNGPMKLNYLQ